MKMVPAVALLSALVVAAGCAPKEAGIEAASSDVMMKLPVTTASDAARQEFFEGTMAADMGRANDANTHFEKAVEADPAFAAGYLQVAATAASTEKFSANLAKAVENAANASRAEQLMIDVMQKGFENNTESQLAAAQQLVEVQGDSPRAWLTLAGVQSGLNQISDARQSLAKAIELAPNFAAAHMQAGNNYMFLEPKDFVKAEEHFRKAIELAPNEATPYDLMGDVHRAQGKLEAAAEDYTMAAARAPEDGSPLQQRGHVHSFLGNHDAARADYTRAMELETAKGNNNAPFYAVFRSYVNIYEGKPEAAIAELREQVAAADAMTVEGKTDIKINALTNIVQISLHYGDFATARQAIDDLAVLLRQQADVVGKDQFRRGQEATITYWEGMLAARQGNVKGAKAKAQEFATLVEPDPNPRKLEPMHQIMGMAEYFQNNYAAADEHLAAGNPNNIYMKYYRGLCQEKMGNADAAEAIFTELATYNFNNVNYAMIRSDVLKAAGMEKPAATEGM
ncbi:MAG TPA: tetratricopeptide repeat protein [Gemmatimonadales bacterium]|nr:tetratricopeptide repeat protein [Gemmatimonadales bacterium]